MGDFYCEADLVGGNYVADHIDERFYGKVVLSCAPSLRGGDTAMAICDYGMSIAFARAGQG